MLFKLFGSFPSDCQVSLGRLLGVSLEYDLGDVAVPPRLVNRSVLEPFVMINEITDTDLHVIRDNVVHDVFDEDLQFRLFILIDLTVIAISELVLDLLDINESAICVGNFEEGVEHHRRIAVEVEKLHLI